MIDDSIYQRMIKKKFEVEDDDHSQAFSHRPPRPDVDGKGNIYIIGLDGSGKSDLAENLAKELDKKFVVVGDGGVTPRDASEADNTVFAVMEDGFGNPEDLVLCRKSGKVLYLMAEQMDVINTLVAAGNDEEKVRADLAQKRESFEPLFMLMLHFIVQGGRSKDELLQDGLEKARL
ncbi:MAG: hypothetical protein ACNI27_11545 [Desulfovibrio sp.]